jgi:hypothetical protein
MMDFLLPEKLSMLTETKDLPVDKHQQIWEDKQKATLEIFSQLGT